MELSDSEMMQMDTMLAAAFRSMKRGKQGDRDKQRQVYTFKTRYSNLPVSFQNQVQLPTMYTFKTRYSTGHTYETNIQLYPIMDAC